MIRTETQDFEIALGTALDVGGMALGRWGSQPQTTVALEELGELVAALARHRRGRGTSEAVVEEIADVLIVTMQLVQMYGVEACTAALQAKSKRLLKRLADVEIGL